jgi:hypothetical protein
MTRYQSLAAYGIIIVITGIIISLLAYNPSRVIQYIVAAGLFLSAFFAFITSSKSKNSVVPFLYHRFQAIGLLLYAIAILIYASSMERFLTITPVFLLYFGITEIILCFQFMELREKVNPLIIAYRIVIGILTGLGAVLILTTSYINPNNALLGSGLAFIFGGAGFILFSWLIRKTEM